MTPYILDWLKDVVVPLGPFGSVFEIGAVNINGSARDVMGEHSESWIACDRFNGPGVSLVANAADWLGFNATRFDTVVACECYEHDADFWITNKAAKNALRAGGLYVISAPSIGFPLHESDGNGKQYGGDFFRFTQSAFHSLFSPFTVLDVRLVGPPGEQCVVGLARK